MLPTRVGVNREHGESMMSGACEIDTTEIERFNKRLITVASSMKNIYKRTLNDIGKTVMRTIDLRFRNSGPNVKGQKWSPILLSSFASRRGGKNYRRLSKAERKLLYEERRAGKTRKTGASLYPNAKPLSVTTGAHVSMRVLTNESLGNYGVEISPTEKTREGKTMLAFHHPPELTGFASKNIMPDRSSMFLNSKDQNSIVEILERERDKQFEEIKK